VGKFAFTRRAERDLDEIFDYIARDNPRAAAELVDRVEDSCGARDVQDLQ
jgi:plasmid stabilization system protein ParE